mmetsp:Transcript_32504/g.40284  ORF Transcript_32504/g.40284 Transcript_32504/m.40284 type:complete len:111 (-) Transcript_32504:1179-1511(-)
MFDFKIADYTSPLIGSNLEVDSSYVGGGAYLSDLIFPEEQQNESESAFRGLRGLSEQATSIFHATAGPSQVTNSADTKGVSPMKSGPENSKEFVELNFQVRYTDDEDKPV